MNGSKIYVKVYAGETIYDRLALSAAAVVHLNATSMRKTLSKLVHIYRLRLPGATLHCLVRALTECAQCRRLVVDYILGVNRIDKVRVHLLPLANGPETIDFTWNAKCVYMARERCDLDHTLSWLSTLGGAFSALGDYFAECAETAARISARQLQLALRLGHPGVAARCRLYFALSLIQRKRFRRARRLVEHEYRMLAKAASEVAVLDERLQRMCLGIWAKLRYEWHVHRTRRRCNAHDADASCCSGLRYLEEKEPWRRRAPCETYDAASLLNYL